jgi:predicted AlkP superfamily phosphohydrolase/phosphomutase
LFFLSTPAWAYIGPGAGFAFISSLLTLLISFLLAFFTLLLLPFRLLISFLRSGKAFANAKFKRIVILGFDGMDPDLCQRFMDQGLLPNFEKLKDQGSFKKLRTTCPPLSPVAWSSFATGVNPAKHRIFDFLHRNPNSYLPELSSSQVREPTKKIRLGNWQIPLSRPHVQFLRKSQSFWKILGKHGIFSQIIRVPITFPPEKFNGVLLSGMCAPDLQGSQGTFTFYSSGKNAGDALTSGRCLPLEKTESGFRGTLMGPENSFKKSSPTLSLDFQLELNEEQTAIVHVSGNKHPLSREKLSSWISVTFKSGFGIKIRGICQMLLKSVEPDVLLYVSPIHIDPERPAMPVSYPTYYSVYLAKLFGPFATLGLAEDTWALNEGVLTESTFLNQVYAFQKEREDQLFHVLKKNRHGVCTVVFDATDRVQHTFFRYLDPEHPAFAEGEIRSKNAILDVYKKADAVLGRALSTISKDTLLLVMSDHGFKSFRRGVNINSWLQQHGYLFLKEQSERHDYLQNVDWSRTTAYAIGLAGIYINRQGREKHGIVEKGDIEELKTKLMRQLGGLKDPETDAIAIRKLYDFAATNHGPYAAEAPDLIVGYNPGYRISWDGAIGMTTDTVFEDNLKDWSGDHGIDPEQVPGVLFSNYKIESKTPHIMDIAPTVLSLFGIKKPHYMDGQDIRFTDL